jgi:hypothetical protein
MEPKTRRIKQTRQKTTKLSSEKKAPDYPIGTIAFYGPDDQFASKAVVGIILAPEDEDVADLKKWNSTGSDVRLDETINQEIFAFIDSHKARKVMMADRIIGCPHEEGIDYPEGEKCPLCPFWADRDRWTGEPVKDKNN